MGLWGKLKESRQKSYNISRVVNDRVVNGRIFEECSSHIVCDIDKTYLETEFESVMKMARIAFEQASDKITVEGAADVLHAARWSQANDRYEKSRELIGPSVGLHFVSSSPPQLRPVLEEKLRLDGLDWDSDTFKNQMYNIRKVRLDLLRQHVGYKTLAILKVASKLKEGTRMFLIGDNAESDPIIYFGVKAFLEKHFTREDFASYLHACGVDAAVVKEIAPLMRSNGQRIDGIFIRRLGTKQHIEWEPFSQVITNFRNYFELVLYFYWLGIISEGALSKLTRNFKNRYGLSERRLQLYLNAAVSDPLMSESLKSPLKNLAIEQKLELKPNVVQFRSEVEFGFKRLNSCRESDKIWGHSRESDQRMVHDALRALERMTAEHESH